jgi:hypothetical protein
MRWIGDYLRNQKEMSEMMIIYHIIIASQIKITVSKLCHPMRCQDPDTLAFIEIYLFRGSGSTLNS